MIKALHFIFIWGNVICCAYFAYEAFMCMSTVGHLDFEAMSGVNPMLNFSGMCELRCLVEVTLLLGLATIRSRFPIPLMASSIFHMAIVFVLANVMIESQSNMDLYLFSTLANQTSLEIGIRNLTAVFGAMSAVWAGRIFIRNSEVL